MTHQLERLTPERHGIHIALAYATADNFTGSPVYRPEAGAWLHEDGARLLEKSVAMADQLGLDILVL
ncbi:MAG TPA: D-alanyl-D-alanine dipeptidase, partial [Rhodospirillaceae bacterium]|nr:D-alanyl-D-alanine dipeptidase [Rhodospirillaceae bacterium]